MRKTAVLSICLAALFTQPANSAHTSAVGLGTGTARAINTDSAMPLAAGRWSASLRLDYVEFDQLSDAKLIRLRQADEDADLHSAKSFFSATLGLAYGVSENLTVGVKVPYIRRSDIVEPEGAHHDEEGDDHDDDHDTAALDVTLAADDDHDVDHEDTDHDDAVHDDDGDEVDIETLGDAEGIGDVSIFGQWRFFHGTDSDTHAALLFGLKTPTGKTDEQSTEGEFELEFQPGSGSWDPFAGVAVSRNFGQLSVDANLLYTLVTEGDQDTDLGDRLAYNLGAARRVSGGEGPAVDLVLELNGEWLDKQDIAGREERNSGGHWLYLSPGIALRGQSWSIAASVGVPIIDDANGDQDGRDYRVTTIIQYTPER